MPAFYQIEGKLRDNTFTLADLYSCLLFKWICSLNVIVPLGVFFAPHLLTPLEGVKPGVNESAAACGTPGAAHFQDNRMPTALLLQIGSDSLCGECVPFPASPVRRGDRCAPAPSPGYLLGASSVLPRLDAAPCPWPRFRHIQNPKSWWGFRPPPCFLYL